MKLRQRLALTAADYNTTQSSMAALCADLIGGTGGMASKRKRGAEKSQDGGQPEEPPAEVCVTLLNGCECVYVLLRLAAMY